MSGGIFSNPKAEFTLIRNILFDHVMPSVSSDAWKILCVALRQAWSGAQPSVNVGQLMAKSGIASREAVESALKACVDAGYLVWDQTSATPDAFVLNVDFAFSEVVPASKVPVPTVERKIEPPAPVPLSPHLEAAFQSLIDFAQKMGAEPDLALVQRAVLDNGADAVSAWIEVGRLMTNLEPPARFKTVLERLLQGVPPLPLSMLAMEDSDDDTYDDMGAPSAQPQDVDDHSPSGLWQKTLDALQSQMRSSKFKFFASTVGVALEGQVLSVEAPTERVREWLEAGQLAPTIVETFKSVAGDAMELRFIVKE